MAGTSYVSGLSSGIDWDNIVTQLISVEHKPVDLVTNKKTSYENQLSAWQSMSTKLSALKTAVDNLKDEAAFSLFTPSLTTNSSTVKGSDIITVTTDSAAAKGTFTVKVNAIAQAEKQSSATFASATTALGEGFAGDMTINGKTLTVSATDTLTSLAAKVNQLNTGTNKTGVTATIVKYAASDYRLIFTADNTGVGKMALENQNIDNYSQLVSQTIVAGANASFTIDGEEITSDSNTVSDAISGVTFNLLKADPDTEVTVRIDRDVNAIKNLIGNFVTAYNDVASYISSQTAYDTTTQKTGGVLFADGTLLSVKNQLTSLLVTSVWGMEPAFSTLGLVGISVDKNGQLSINDEVLTNYLTTNLDDITALFSTQAQTSSNEIGYIAHRSTTQPGEYAVNITQAATRATSTPSDAGELIGDEILTITSGSATATVNLTSGMTVDNIVVAINKELTTAYAQTLVGANSLYADAEKITPLTAQTTWDSVYTDSGPANLAADDVITFSGTTRTGKAVTGSYTITNPATDTVQGLLSAIEAAYGNSVTASIDNSGRIVLTDKTTGTSNLSLSFNYEQAHDLDFGTVSNTNDGGVTGRYAMDITAVSQDGKLALQHNQYGSTYSFTIHQEHNLLWAAGDQTVNNGRDVAGTINGEAATGSGQILRSDAGAAQGLTIKYTGTNTGNVGTVKLTVGIAELFSRALSGMVDPIDGYVTHKQTSLQNTIKSLTDKITEMEERLDKKKVQLMSRFAKMELALSQIQTQSNWLTSQVALLNKNWGGTS